MSQEYNSSILFFTTIVEVHKSHSLYDTRRVEYMSGLARIFGYKYPVYPGLKIALRCCTKYNLRMIFMYILNQNKSLYLYDVRWLNFQRIPQL